MAATRAPASAPSRRPRSISPLGSCKARSASVSSRRRSQAGSPAAADTIASGSARKAGRATQYEAVEPQALVIEHAEGVVAEQVRVGGHDHPALAVAHRGEQTGARRVGIVAGAQHDGALALGAQRASTVEADGAHEVQQARLVDVLVGLAEHPGGGAVVAHVVLDRAAVEGQAKALQQLAQVGAVLVLFGLAQHDQAAAVGDEGGDRLDLGDRQDGGTAHGALPARVGGVGDDQHVDAAQGVGRQRSRRQRRDVEVALGERRGGERVRRPRGVLRLNSRGDVWPHAPGLTV